MRQVRGALESYDAERADFQRLLAALRLAQTAPLEALRDLAWITEYVSLPGLAPLHPADETYVDQVHLMNGSHQGIGQYPSEFARWLQLLAGQPPLRSYLEIGCFNGHTAALAAAYLRRFHPELRLTTIDLWPWFLFAEEVRAFVPLDYRVGVTSFMLRETTFDAVFIDGDHTFEWAWADYQNAGRAARVCGLHDIASIHYLEGYELGGVTTVWDVIRRDEAGLGIEFHEFCDHPAGDRFGIGVRVRTTVGT